MLNSQTIACLPLTADGDSHIKIFRAIIASRLCFVTQNKPQSRKHNKFCKTKTKTLAQVGQSPAPAWPGSRGGEDISHIYPVNWNVFMTSHKSDLFHSQIQRCTIWLVVNAFCYKDLPLESWIVRFGLKNYTAYHWETKC